MILFLIILSISVIFILLFQKISKKINLFGFKNSNLGEFNLANIELLIKKDLVQKKLIKPIYLS